LEANWETKTVAALRGYVARRLSFSESEIDVKILSRGAWSAGVFDEEPIEVQERFQETLLGRTVFLITVKRDGEKAASRWVTAEIAVIRRVVVPVHPLKKLQPIEQRDVTIHAVRLTRPGEHYAVKPEELIGKRMVRSINTGTPVTLDMVEEAPVIRQGDRVTLVVQVGGLRIVTTGRAKEDGFQGRQVAVVNLDSQKIVYGEVVDPSTVRIDLSKD